MTTYEVEFSQHASRQLRKIGPQARRRIEGAIELLGVNPRPPRAKKIVGGLEEWRVRVGDYRVLYEIHDRRLLVLVVAVGHRRQIYERR